MKKILFLLLITAFAITLSACTKNLENPEVNNGYTETAPTDNNQTTETTPADTNAVEMAGITLSEVSQHGAPSDCWLAIDGRVFDVTPYIKLGIHPGGEKILNGCGKEASAMFASVDKHADKGRAALEKYVIGVLVQ